ncbi:MAG: DUF559 domain-containing protein, partial [Frankiales bacterium]|nr:DUF559 domain-containing protein [Frankiales bacterium]
AARLLIPPHGVLCGLTAAYVLGIDVRRLNDLDVHVGFPKGKRIRKRPGLVVCQETLAETDIAEIDGTRVTTPLRTAFDCLRWLRGAERIVVADALAHAGLVDPAELARYFAARRRLRNLRIGERLVEFIEPMAESPMESRSRYELVNVGGLPRPVVQHPVHDTWGTLVGILDMAYPEVKVGVEYDGAFHWLQRRADERRRAAMRALGWWIIVLSDEDIFRTPINTVAEVRRALRARAA